MSRHALVFGHSSGLGHEVSRQLLARGDTVVGVARSRASLDARRLVQIQADLSHTDELHELSERIRDEHGTFDLLIFTAGALTSHDMSRIDPTTLDYLYRVNVFAPVIIESALLDLIEANGSDVVNVTSSSLVDFYPALSEYSSSKAAVAKFTSDLRKRLEKTSARVIDFCPSGFSSSMYASMSGDPIARDESIQMPVDAVAALLISVVDLPKRIEVGHIHLNRKAGW